MVYVISCKMLKTCCVSCVEVETTHLVSATAAGVACRDGWTRAVAKDDGHVMCIKEFPASTWMDASVNPRPLLSTMIPYFVKLTLNLLIVRTCDCVKLAM